MTTKSDIDFLILRCVRAPNQKHVLAEVKYSDVKEFDGRRIIIVEMDMNEFCMTKRFDHDFKEGSKTPCVAYFEPTSKGWIMANRYLKMLDPSLPL